jgi:hypothetical protein
VTVMATQAAQVILAVVGAYIGAGLLFGAVFITRSVHRMDHAARGAPWTFRLLILPGVVALWPVLWRRIAQSRKDGHA